MIVELDTEGVGEFRNVHAITSSSDNLQNFNLRKANLSKLLHIVFGHFPGIPSNLFAELEHGVFLRILDDLAPIFSQCEHFVQLGPAVLTEKLSVGDGSIGTAQLRSDGGGDEFLLSPP